MIPSDHFVKFYNEIFKFLERKGPEALDRYYARVAERQAYFTLDAFRRWSPSSVSRSSRA